MKMDQLEAMRQSLALQYFAGGNQADGIEPELGVLPAAGCPFARAFAVQAHPDANQRLDPDFLGGPDGLLELFQLFNHDDDQLAQFAPHKCDPNKGRILVAIANNQTFRVLVHGQGSDQLRLASRLQAEVKSLAGVNDLFDHFTQLIDFDREDTAVFSSVIEFRNCGLEGSIHRFDAVPEQILKADDEGKGEPARARFVHHFENGNVAPVFLKRLGYHVAVRVDGKVTGSPTFDVVGGVCRLQVPIVFRHFVSGCKADNY